MQTNFRFGVCHSFLTSIIKSFPQKNANAFWIRRSSAIDFISALGDLIKKCSQRTYRFHCLTMMTHSSPSTQSQENRWKFDCLFIKYLLYIFFFWFMFLTFLYFLFNIFFYYSCLLEVTEGLREKKSYVWFWEEFFPTVLQGPPSPPRKNLKRTTKVVFPGTIILWSFHLEII